MTTAPLVMALAAGFHPQGVGLMVLRKCLYWSLLVIVIFSLLTPPALFAEEPVEEVMPPIPHYATANVDGARQEWLRGNSALSNFALIYAGGVQTTTPIGRLRLRYDCRAGQGVLYALTSVININAYLPSTPQSITLNGTSIVNQNSGDNGNPPDFAFMDNNNGGAGIGWESSARVAGGSYTLNMVVTMSDSAGVQQTGRLAPAGSGVPIVIPTETCILAVTLEDFRATPQSDSVLLEWETAQETDNLGFNLYRSTSPDETGEKLNSEMIPSAVPGSGQGASYTFEDTTGEGGVTYYYRLEDIDFEGTATMHDPVSAIYPSAPTAVTLAIFQNVAHEPLWGFGTGVGSLAIAGAAAWRWRHVIRRRHGASK